MAPLDPPAGGRIVTARDDLCRAELATENLGDGKFHYQLTLAGDRLDPGYEARAVLTLGGDDGSPPRKWVTPWLSTAPGSVRTSLTVHREVTDVHVEYRRIAG